jgi:HK97 family phage prohead protease
MISTMGLLRRLARSLFAARRVQFDASPPVTIDAAITAARGGGACVSRADALSVSAVQRGRNMLCSIATLPLIQQNADREIVDNPLFRQLDPDVANVVTLAQTVEDLVFDAVSWWKVTARGFDGFPVNIQHLDISTVSITPPAGMGSLAPLPSGIDPRGGVIWVDGVATPWRDIIRFDSPNPAVLVHGGRAIRRALLLEKAAEMYADDPRAQDYFSPADGAEDVDDDEVAVILAKWKAARKRRSTAWVPSAMKYNTVDSPSPADLQLVELQKQASLDIANALGIDPEDLGVSTTSRTYQNDVDRRRNRVNDVLAPYMRAVTDRLSMTDVTKRGHTVTFLLSDYLKSNPTERANVQKTYLDMGVIDEDEIRTAEGYPGPAPGRQAAAPADNPAEAAAMDAARRALVSLAANPLTFVSVPVEQFSVDMTTRVIKGLVLPYGKYAQAGGLRVRFSKGALQFADVSRVKLLRDHDPHQPLGVATKLTDSGAGMMAEFKVARGAAGDEALILADDGVLDGFSVGIDFDENVDAVQDPKDKRAVLVNRADLREVSLTALPAFDDARVTAVAASLTGGNAMPCTKCGQVHAEGVACQTPEPSAPAAVTLSADQFSALLARFGPAEPEGPTVVNPTRLTASTAVTEPPAYRFDRRGNLRPGSHEFSADLIAALRDSDVASYQRSLAFIQAQFDVVTTNVNELNPTGNRPDMYVDQRTYKYPIWDAINKGTLTDITPFTFPKFSSASGLIGSHSEGSEPSSGTFVTTSDTVTPTANSGKAKISRETWDQGGNPQIGNLIWQQMLKGWYEALEAAAVAVLDAATPTGIDFSGTPGLANDDLDQALTAALAALQFVRGGFSMDKAFTQIDLYKALAAATGTDGRRLYPVLGPANAGGTTASRFGSIDVNGVEFLPAWALAATGTVAASSYLFDSGSVHGWASAPQRITIDMTEVANVYIGIWGYKATVISDINGVRELIYDPA